MATRYVNTNSTAGGDGTTNNTSGSNRAYATLVEWEAARQADLTATETELVYCDGTAAEVLTSAFNIDGWTTDATHYIDIRGNTNSRASTEWSTSKYRITGNGNGNNPTVSNLELYVRFDGLQLEADVSYLSSATRYMSVIQILNTTTTTLGADCRISNCHVRIIGAAPFNPMTPTLSSSCCIYFQPSTNTASPTPNGYVWNNIVSFEATGTFGDSGNGGWVGIAGVHRNQNFYVYNNTVRGAWLHGEDGDDNTNRIHYLKNNIFSGMVTAATRGSHVNTRCDYNATNLADLGYTAGSNDRVSQTFTFVSSTNYAITSGDTGAKDFGLTDPGSGLFSDDIDAKTRSGSWDIGAFEVSASALYRIRQFANGWFQSAQFVEVVGGQAMRMYANGTVQVQQMVEIA